MPTGVYDRAHLTRPLEERFWARVHRRGEYECWLWQGATTTGYGVMQRGAGRKGLILAHRLSWEIANGPIPEGLHLDHLCRTPRCVNPNHLEVVTHRENVIRGIGPTAENARKTHCKRGHSLSGDNLYYRASRNQRECKTCMRDLRERRKGQHL